MNNTEKKAELWDKYRGIFQYAMDGRNFNKALTEYDAWLRGEIKEKFREDEANWNESTDFYTPDIIENHIDTAGKGKV